MRIVKSVLSLAALLFMMLTAVPALGPAVAFAQTTTAGSSTCINHLFGSGSVTGGKQITFRARLGAPAPAGGVIVLLSSDSAAIAAQTKVIIPEGLQEFTFQVASSPVAVTELATLTGTTGDCSASKTVTVKAPVLRSISVQSVMRSGGAGKVTVCLTGRAAADVAVNMTSNNAVAIPDANFVVPAGKGCASFAAPVGVVDAPTPVTITAEAGGASRSGSTTVKVFEA